jgi:hypothetical protein
MPISSAELKAIEIAANFIFQQTEQSAVILTDSRTPCQILMKAMEGDRHHKIALRILPEMAPSSKMHTEYWSRRSGKNGTTAKKKWEYNTFYTPA